MIKRRSTLKLGLSGYIGTLLPLSAFAANPGPNKQGQFKVLFNSKYQESQNLALALKDHQLELLDISQDLGSIWYRQLKQSLAGPNPVMFGLTDRIDLFCLEELARDLGMMTRFRVEHSIDAAGRVQHLPADQQDIQDIDRLLSDQAGFGFKVTELATLALQNEQHFRHSYKKSGPFSSKDKTTLATWMIS